jgi:hypothetical protein
VRIEEDADIGDEARGKASQDLLEWGERGEVEVEALARAEREDLVPREPAPDERLGVPSGRVVAVPVSADPGEEEPHVAVSSALVWMS